MTTAEGRRLSEKELMLNMALSANDSKDHCQTSHSEQVLCLQDSCRVMLPPARPNLLASRSSKRLSLSLPVQAGERDAAWPIRRTVIDSDPSTRQSSPSSEADQNASIRTSNDFLVALAAQERKVLELKEELYRADNQLKRLKRQWALYESSRNRDVSNVETSQLELQYVQPAISGAEKASSCDVEENISRRSLHMDIERRKAVLTSLTKDSRRTVIRGGHTRALSLLSPIQGHYGHNLQSPQAPSSPRAPAANGISLYPKTQSSTASSSNKSRHTNQGSATTGVKQIAEDIKSGLWTFMEDLRQATVGDEAVKGTTLAISDVAAKGPTRKCHKIDQMTSDQNRSRCSLPRPLELISSETQRRRLTPATSSHKSTQGIKANSEMSPSVVKKVEISSSMDDDWSNWDSPISKDDSGQWSNGTIFSSNHASNKSSPIDESEGLSLIIRDPTSKHDEPLWPVLNDFMPSNIKRTASAIIREWEKSLVNSSVDERQDHLSSVTKSARNNTEDETRLLLNNLP